MNFENMVKMFQVSDYIFAVFSGGTHDSQRIKLDSIKATIWFSKPLEVYSFSYLCYDNTWAFKLIENEKGGDHG